MKNPATGKSSPRMRDQSEWYRSEGLHEPIISRELFDKAQEIRKKNTHNQSKVYNPDHAAVFSGLLVCPVCGAPMHGVGGMGKVKLDGKHGGGQYYYSCADHRRRKGEHQCPYAKGWRQEIIDSLMADIIVQIASDEKFREDISDRIGTSVDSGEYERQAENISNQIRNKNKTLKRKMLAIDNFDWDIENADCLYDALNEDYNRLHAEISSLEQGLREVEDMIANIRNQQISKDNVCKFILQFGKIYKQLTEVEKKEVARNLIERVEIFPEEQKDGSIIKSVTFRIPLKNGESRLDFGDDDRQTTGINVETVVLMSRVDGK